ncbi:unnamed protein product, partial [Pylaiella littoralis]
MHKQWKNIKKNYRQAKERWEDKSGGGGTEQDDDDGDDGDDSAGDGDGGGGGGDDEGKSHAWAYCDGNVVNYVVNLLIESGGDFVGEMKDYFSVTLDEGMCLDTIALDVDSDSGVDSMDEAFSGDGGSGREKR